MKSSNTPVRIEKIVPGGLGLGRRDDGKVVLIGAALPDEEVNIAITEDKGHYLLAEITAIRQAHPARITPPCPWYGRCGGCDLQHCDYSQQLRIKTDILRDLLPRHLPDGHAALATLVQDTLPSPSQFGYRQRIRLLVDADGTIGFRGFRSHTIVPVGRCLVAGDALNTVLAELPRNAAGKGLLSHCSEVELLFNPLAAKVVCLLHLTRKPRPADIRQARELAASLPLVERAFFMGAGFALTGPFGEKSDPQETTLRMRIAPFDQEDAPLTLCWEVGGFCQVNLPQNERLIRQVLDLFRIDKGDSILDLFCGMGNFSIPLARRAASLTGIEGQGAAIRSARHNSRIAGYTNTTFEKAPIHESCRRLVREGRRFDCVVIDPPRQGVPGLARELTYLTRKRLVYVSCDPATLCRDLAELTRHGLTILHIQPIDMFPQTHHIETVVLLEKN